MQENGRQIDASILLSKDGQLRLEQPDGSVVTVPLRDLTESDRLWAERQLHEIRLLNTQPATQLLALQTGRRDREPINNWCRTMRIVTRIITVTRS